MVLFLLCLQSNASVFERLLSSTHRKGNVQWSQILFNGSEPRVVGLPGVRFQLDTGLFIYAREEYFMKREIC